MLFLNRCKSMIDPDSEGYLSNFSDFEELEPSGQRIGKPKTQNVIRKGYIDNAVSNTYPIGFTSTVSLQNWNVGITTRKTNMNKYVYFLQMKEKNNKTKGKKQKKDMIRCIISNSLVNGEFVNGATISLGGYQVFEIGEGRTKWAALTNFVGEKVVIKLQNLDNLKNDIYDVFKKLTDSTTTKTINWVQAP